VQETDTYDVAIIGGGAAGSTAATLLAKAGRRVIVFEREKFPRFHIGESLLPFSVQTFDRLGVREKLDHTFLPKFGMQRFFALSPRLTLLPRPQRLPTPDQVVGATS
jgi:flavin-dependent dehydrogenase